MMFFFNLDLNCWGNRIVRVRPKGYRAFSIKTQGNLPKTHQNGIGHYTMAEVREYVKKFGTDRQWDLFFGVR